MSTKEQNNERIFSMSFSKLYPCYVQKAEKKKRSKQEVNEIICWLTGYTQNTMEKEISKETTVKDFFKNAPKMNPARKLITGTICGVKIEDIKEPVMKEIRYLDKLVDELAKGKAMEKILR